MTPPSTPVNDPASDSCANSAMNSTTNTSPISTPTRDPGDPDEQAGQVHQPVGAASPRRLPCARSTPPAAPGCRPLPRPDLAPVHTHRGGVPGALGPRLEALHHVQREPQHTLAGLLGPLGLAHHPHRRGGHPPPPAAAAGHPPPRGRHPLVQRRVLLRGQQLPGRAALQLPPGPRPSPPPCPLSSAVLCRVVVVPVALERDHLADHTRDPHRVTVLVAVCRRERSRERRREGCRRGS